jgi:hypothetical protein
MGLASLGLGIGIFLRFPMQRSPIERAFGARFLSATPIPAAGPPVSPVLRLEEVAYTRAVRPLRCACGCLYGESL